MLKMAVSRTGREQEPAYKIYGKQGDPDFLHGLPPGSEGYRVQTTKVVITAEEKRLGRAVQDIFDNSDNGLNRVQPWSIVNGIIQLPDVSAQRDIQIGARSSAPFETSIPISVIPTSALRGEQLSQRAVRATRRIYAIEAWLTDYTEAARMLFRGNQGVSDTYDKWTAEESMHVRAARTVLIETGNGDPEDMDDVRDLVLTSRWTPPFSTGRRMLIYAYPQERLTGETDFLLAKAMREEGNAPLSARIFTEGIGSDEFYHSFVFENLIGVYAQDDPKGTEEDAYFVSEHFLMPGDLISHNPRENASVFNHIGVDKNFIAKSLHRSMAKLDKDLQKHLKGKFLDMSRIRDIICYRVGLSPTDNEAWQKLLAGTR